jgi:hypothetical protein
MTDVGGLVRSVNPVSPEQPLLSDDELDALLVLINERNTETDIEALARRVESGKPSLRGWLVAAAAAVFVLVVLAPVLLAGRDVEPDVGGTEPDVPATTTLQAPTPPSSEAGWSRVSHDASVFAGFGGQSMRDVTVGGPGFVAVGADNADAAVWTSLDGFTWSRVPHDEGVFGGAGMGSVTVGGPGLVAVGSSQPDNGGAATVWTSADGVTWLRVPHDEDVFGGAEMSDVTAGGPGLVAVGVDDYSDRAVWTSSDGITWLRVPHDEADFGGEGDTWMNSVTVGGPGLVAVGAETQWHEESGDSDAAVWTSSDGIIWSRVPHDEDVFGGPRDQEMLSVTAGGPGLVAVGQVDMGRTPVWTSIDGITWSRVPDDSAVRGRMMSVIVGGPGLVAVGAEGPGLVGGDGEGASVRPPVWTSVDGITWTRDPVDETAVGWWRGSMTSVTIGGPGLVAVGFEGGTAGGDAAVWNAAVKG